MATVIKAGNVASGAQVTSDATGILQFNTGSGAGTTAMTIGTDQNVTFAQAANLPNTFGFKNRIINGAMVIDQRNAGASVTVGGDKFVVDRWVVEGSALSKLTAQQSSTVPVGFTKSILVTSSSAYSVAAGDFFGVFQAIEGVNVADLNWGTANAQSITISFLVRSSLTGTFGGAIENAAGNRSYPFSYTISSANTFEYKTITIPGDTTGTWVTDTTGRGLVLRFGLGVGSTYSGTAGSWSSTRYFSVTGAVSVVGTNGATFYITGVQLEKGSTATSFDYRPYGTELQLCQRYFTRFSNDGTGIAGIGSGFQITTTDSLAIVNFPVQMRSEPTVAISSLQVGDRFSYDADVTLNVIRAGYQSAELTFTNAASGAQYRPLTLFVKNNTSGFLNLSAEL